MNTPTFDPVYKPTPQPKSTPEILEICSSVHEEEIGKLHDLALLACAAAENLDLEGCDLRESSLIGELRGLLKALVLMSRPDEEVSNEPNPS